MIFRNFFSSFFSNPKPSTHLAKLPQDPSSLTTSIQPQELNGKHASRKIFEGYSFAVSNGIKPVPQPLKNKFIRTRIETGHEKIINMQKELKRVQSELNFTQCLHQQQKKFAREEERRAAEERLSVTNKNRNELMVLMEKMVYWELIAEHREKKVSETGEKVLQIRNEATASASEVETLRAEREELRAQLTLEKAHADATEKHCDETVSSVRQRVEHEKELLRTEAKELRETGHKKDDRIAELNKFGEDSMHEMEEKEHQIALHESNEAIDSFSQSMSCILSEMSEVVLFAQEDWQDLGEKMQTILDVMRELASEVNSRRELYRTAAMRIYMIEQEKLWHGCQ